MPSSPLSVTVVSGFVGSGKTAVLDHALRHAEGRRVAVVANDLSGNFEREVARLAREGRLDWLLVESAGIMEPSTVAVAVALPDDEGRSLGDLARLETMVTVVDAAAFEEDLLSGEELAERGFPLAEGDNRGVGDALVEQVEFANVLVLNKCDLVDEATLGRIQALLRALNPKARVVRAIHGQVPADAIFQAGLFDFDQMVENAGWVCELRGEHLHCAEAEEFGIASFVFRARRPFHPARLMDFVEDDPDFQNVLRSKGFAWFATRHDLAAHWQLAGQSFYLDPTGSWIAVIPREEWPDAPEFLAEIATLWEEPWGDRRQELVFIGEDMDEAAIRAGLEAALLTDEEMRLGPDGWASFEDPLPEWEEHVCDENCGHEHH